MPLKKKPSSEKNGKTPSAKSTRDAGEAAPMDPVTVAVGASAGGMEALQKSEKRYRTLFNTLLEGFCIIDVLFDADNRPIDYRFLEMNPAFETQTGLRNAQGKRMRELVPEHEAYWFEVYGKVALTGEPVHFVNEAKALNRWYNVTAYKIDGRDSRKVAILFNDITEAKRAEEGLRRHNATLEGIRGILEAAVTCRTESDLGAACLEIAQNLTQSKFGFIGEINENGFEEIAISNPDWDACNIITAGGHRSPPGNFKIHGIYGRVISDGKALFTNAPADHPDRIGLPAGHPPLDAFLGAPLIREGRTIGMIAVANRPGGYTPAKQKILIALAPAIAEAFLRKRAEQELAASESRYRDLAEFIPTMLWAADVQGVTLDHNRRWYDYTGQMADQARGDGWKAIVHPDDVRRVGDQWGRSVRTGDDYAIEYRIRRVSDGTYRWHSVQARLRKDEQGLPLGWFGTCIDIEDRKQAEEALKENERKLSDIYASMSDGLALHEVIYNTDFRSYLCR